MPPRSFHILFVAFSLLCMAGGAFAQRLLDNRVIPWKAKQGIVCGAMIDESSMDLDIRYAGFGLRTGYFAGLTVPLQTAIKRTPGLQGGFLFFPNPFHSRMDPFVFVRGQVTYEEAAYRANLSSYNSLTERPEGFCVRIHAGYGFNVNLSKYLYIHHLLGLGQGWDITPGKRTLGKLTMMFSAGVGYHLFSKISDRKLPTEKPKPNQIEL